MMKTLRLFGYITLFSIGVIIVLSGILTAVSFLDKGNSRWSLLFENVRESVELIYEGDINQLIARGNRKLHSFYPASHSVVTKSTKIAMLYHPWGMDFAPINGIDQLLVTERFRKNIAVIENDELWGKLNVDIVENITAEKEDSELTKKKVYTFQLYDVAFDPDYDNQDNQYIYVSAIIKTKGPGELGCENHAILKIRYDYEKKKILNKPITQDDIIFETNDTKAGGTDCRARERGVVVGNRIHFLRDKTLLFSIGYSNNDHLAEHSAEVPAAQDMGYFESKLLRMTRNGIAVCDRHPLASNPFCDRSEKAAKYIHTLGHKDIQGITEDADGNIWTSEHGPHRGDEINRIVAGNNYGFPYLCVRCRPYVPPFPISYSEYEKSPALLSARLIADGHSNPSNFVQTLIKPVYSWEDYAWNFSIAPSGIDYYSYEGEFHNNLFIATLANEKLERLKIQNDGKILREDPLYQGIRIRDVQVRDAENIYVLIDHGEGDTVLKFTLRTK